jgi:hypothetical protein
LTSEQTIILALLAAAFVAGWIARGSTSGGESEETGEDLEPAAKRQPVQEPSPAEGFESAVRVSRQALDRAIGAYHTAVALWLREGEAGTASEAMFEVFARDLTALATAVDGVSAEFELRHPLSEKLRQSGSELRRLAVDVSAYSRERRLPTGVFDRSEQHLMSAASTISVCTPEPRTSRRSPRRPLHSRFATTADRRRR